MSDFPDLSGRVILQVVPELSAGGVEQTVLEVAEAISLAGGRALIASRGGRLEPELARLGGELLRMDARSRNPLILAMNVQRLRRIIRACKVDIVHARSRAPAWSAWAAARAEGAHFVTTYHGAYSGRSGLKIAYNSIMARGERVIANSAWIAEHVRQVHGIEPGKIVTIPRGVDLERFDPGAVTHQRVEAVRSAWGLAADRRLTLLLPGRLTEWKGQGLAVEALSLLSAEERAGLVLILAGDPQGRIDYVRRLGQEIESHGLAGTVLIMPHIVDMPAACLAADIILAPSLRPEAFGRVAAEAAAMERPVIVSDHGGGRETVLEGETGARFEPGSRVALSGVLRTMVSLRPGVRAAMGQAGRRHVVGHFSKRGLQTATLNVYKTLLETG